MANTSFFEKDIEITNHFDILVNYLKTTFFPDLFTLIILYNKENNYQLLNLLFLIRLFYFAEYVPIIKEYII